MALSGDFTPILAKHTKSFNLVDTLSVGVDRIQRKFGPMQRQVESWPQTQITDARAKLIFYSAPSPRTGSPVPGAMSGLGDPIRQFPGSPFLANFRDRRYILRTR
jgi:hypothetical protein